MATETAPTSRWLSAKQAAEILGVNRMTVINWARRGKLPGIQYGEGAIYRFQESDIRAFIERSRLPTRETTDWDVAKDEATR